MRLRTAFMAVAVGVFACGTESDVEDQSGFVRSISTAADTSGWPDWQRRLAEEARRRPLVVEQWDVYDEMALLTQIKLGELAKEG